MLSDSDGDEKSDSIESSLSKTNEPNDDDVLNNQQPPQTISASSSIDYGKLRSDNSEERQQQLTHIAEEAQKLQPKGFTLETTQVLYRL
jgi:hypothetical protein